MEYLLRKQGTAVVHAMELAVAFQLDDDGINNGDEDKESKQDH